MGLSGTIEAKNLMSGLWQRPGPLTTLFYTSSLWRFCRRSDRLPHRNRA
jgi:hypothetical protein